ncbi:MAG TPA: serine--tRNA ligase [Acidimicrobiales bacterium]|nr:serine--tRNA ligase [Acidimicrobiales bacterium]
MIDIRRVRADLDGVKAAMGRRHDPALIEDLDRLSALDERLRTLSTARDELRAQVNTASKAVGEAYKAGDRARGDELKAQSRALGDEEKGLAAETADVESQLRDLLLWLPNLPADEAPDGESEHDNVVLRQEGPDPSSYADHQRVPHWETGADLGLLDLERGAKVSGSMFTVLRGGLATMSRALCQLALDRNADLYEEVRPPTLVRTETLTASGQLPKFADESYLVERDDLWAIATAEIPLASLYRDEVLDEVELPTRLMAFSPCFRREAGAAGRDTRGLLRVHEFDKVELFALSTPEQAPALLDEMLARAEARLADLGLTYRLLEICTGDFGQAHHRSIDLEVYAPGVDAWLEVSSVSWVSDYQSRRANLRYRPAATDGPRRGTELVHTLNGSALATPRILAALLEVHRRPDGSVRIPEVLHPYCRGLTSLSKSSLARG